MSALIYCPFPNREAARAIASQLLDEEWIACANVLGEVESLYQWEGERGQASEVAVLLKTNASLLDRAVARLSDLHPYDVPAVLGWKCDAVGGEAAAWLSKLSPGSN
ncbi:divalent-cation tolerance protein CutA [Altererythrobacter lutimaris]|uniref:Divalent-cation tolerance protein CutA n=1 Tax=Altererythrobacter lutimaris TaxID=2743979 RepID=A0A850HCU0_9SPHN|nr:divalent-cation tolerance protein CutA [Altererythrobacter lutimaris]NVE95370.1 divalent-cation tolerance protein CutA [Altererythrobacter lutimaris]